MSAPAHTNLSFQQFLTKKLHDPIPHPPYSLNLALGNFVLFSQIKKVLKEKRFDDVEEVKQKISEALKRNKN